MDANKGYVSGEVESNKSSYKSVLACVCKAQKNGKSECITYQIKNASVHILYFEYIYTLYKMLL